MSKIALWYVNYLTKKLEKNKKRINQMREWIKKTQKQNKYLEKEINKYLKKLSREEYLLYGLKNGFVNRKEFEAILKSLK